MVRFGSFRRLTPISRQFGFDRGNPIDRYYIENFLARQADDIQGRVLEIGDNSYTLRYGGKRIAKSDVLHVVGGNPQATIVGDLTKADHIPSDSFDCIILTQTLHLIYDVRAALRTLYRILKPGGILLATFPGLSQIIHEDWGAEWHWGFTSQSARELFREVFPIEKVNVEAHGNVLTAISFLHGLAAEELKRKELDYRDPHYELLITARAEKPDQNFLHQMQGRWEYENNGRTGYGDDTTYRKGMEFLDGHGTIEDWGCGTAYAKKFVKESKYLGIDGSQSKFTDVVEDLREHTFHADCVFMRHVLEHNHDWQKVLKNAVQSFQKRMVLVVFTPFSDETQQISSWSGIPDISFRKSDLTRFFHHLNYSEESLQTNTQYKTEHVFYIEK